MHTRGGLYAKNVARSVTLDDGHEDVTDHCFFTTGAVGQTQRDTQRSDKRAIRTSELQLEVFEL